MVVRESGSYLDLVRRVDSLEQIEQLSLVVHRPLSEGRVMGFMICSYADESADSRVYSVSGLIGRLRDFVELERQWRLMLPEKGISEFHASKLEFAQSPFDRLDRDQRDDIQRTFIGLITKMPIWGFHGFIELEAYELHKAELQRLLPSDQSDPYKFTFRLVVEQMAVEVEDYQVKNEPIAFVFDQQQQHQGKAKEIYDHLATAGNWPLAHRLGSLTFASRHCYLCLQAADAWAYEARKNVSDAYFEKRPERWQMTLFKDAGRFNLSGYSKLDLPKMIARAHDDYRARGITV